MLGLGSVGTVFGGTILGGTAMGMSEARRARRNQRRAQRVQSAMEARNLRRERMGMLRESQMARAMGQQAAATSGVADSSGFRGAQAGMQATYLGNTAFSQQTESGVGVMQQYVDRAGAQMGRAERHQQMANLGLSVTGFMKGGV